MTNTEAKYAANIGKMVKCIMTEWHTQESITKYAIISAVEKAFNNKFRYDLRYLTDFTDAEYARFGRPNKVWCKDSSREHIFKMTVEE
jgi:hypothetical protein